MFDFKELKISRNFGVELEVGNEVHPSIIVGAIVDNSTFPIRFSEEWDIANNNNYWQVKRDSSCGVIGKGHDAGWEIASFKANSDIDLKEICKIVHILSKKLHVNDNCGLHFHVEVLDFTDEQLGIMIANWAKIEHFLFQLVPARRRNNFYCLPISKYKKFKYAKRDNPTDFFYSILPNNISYYENAQRRFAINLVNISHYMRNVKKDMFLGNVKKTVEFRFPEGTLNCNDVYFWTHLFISFIENAKKLKMPKNMENVITTDEFFDILGLGHTEGCFSFFDNNIIKLKKWIFNRIIMFGENKYSCNIIGEQ